MCVIFFYANANPVVGSYKLILASNRDEFYARETRGASKWGNAEHVYGGIDLEKGREGGSWLAIGGRKGIFKVGALLNLTGEPKPRNSVGRGMIVSDFVTTADDSSIEDYNNKLVSECTKYSAFNFVSIEIGIGKEPARVTLCSNAPPGLIHYEQGRCYGFGNSLPTEPFEKVQHGQERFEVIVKGFHAKLNATDDESELRKAEMGLINNLLDLLKCKEKFWPDPELERRAPNWGEYLSAINVNVPDAGYGSRTHTVILVDANDKLHFVEETMAGEDPEGKWTKTHIEKQYFKND